VWTQKEHVIRRSENSDGKKKTNKKNPANFQKICNSEILGFYYSGFLKSYSYCNL